MFDNIKEDIASVFEEVYDFSYTNIITSNRKNFFDPAHFYPKLSKSILDCMFHSDQTSNTICKKLNSENSSHAQ